jgi:hypothetical protein
MLSLLLSDDQVKPLAFLTESVKLSASARRNKKSSSLTSSTPAATAESLANAERSAPPLTNTPIKSTLGGVDGAFLGDAGPLTRRRTFFTFGRDFMSTDKHRKGRWGGL